MARGEQVPETQYATLGEDRIAYQVFGEGEVDLLWVPPSGDCIDLRWEWPPDADLLFWLGTQARVISFDRRGAGASDPASGEALPRWEGWADDALAVLDAVGSERAVIIGAADSGPTAILFAASHPARTQGLILINTLARWAAAPDYPAGLPEEAVAHSNQLIRDAWGTGAFTELSSPDLVRRDPEFRRHEARSERLYMSPTEASRLLQFESSSDVREVLTSIRVPTLVLHAEGLEFIPPEHGRYLAEHIAGARLAILPGNDFTFTVEPAVQAVRPLIEEFLSGLQRVPEPDRALAAILFTDIVGSTERASSLGDREWRNLLESHDMVARTVVEQHRGRLVKMTGDGMLATFDGPGRAIRCAMMLADTLRPLGLEIRAGLHTGEVEVRGTDIAGIGVHIAARVMTCAQPGELLVSAAVPMLVAGSGIKFEDRGEHELKGVSDPWRLFSVKG
jgi:class 3 adenylate cyclase